MNVVLKQGAFFWWFSVDGGKDQKTPFSNWAPASQVLEHYRGIYPQAGLHVQFHPDEPWLNKSLAT